ncbi:MAG: sulfur oxidation c-type cytochrome SoxX [Bacillota bacterium]
MAALATAAHAAHDALDAPLAPKGDPARGREIFIAREGGHCVLCHAAPGVGVAGNIGPSLSGVASRLTAGQIRLRIVDITRVKPNAVMPAFHRTKDLKRVAANYAGRPALDAQQVEDLVAYLGTLE